MSSLYSLRIYSSLVITALITSFAFESAALAARRASRTVESLDVPEVRTYEEDDDRPKVPRAWTQAALGFYQFDYKESFAPPKKSTENGLIPGLHIDGGFRFFRSENSASLRGILDVASSSTVYDGSTQSGKPLTGTTNNQFVNLESDIVANLVTLNPGRSYLKGYSGMGFRTWTRDLQGAGGYKEDYSWLYLPLGIIYENKLSSSVSLAVEGTYKIMLYGKMVAHLAEKDSGYNDLDVTLGNKPGYKIQTPLGISVAKQWKLMITPWYEYSAIGESDSKFIGVAADGRSMYGTEPESRTYQYGGNVGVQAEF